MAAPTLAEIIERVPREVRASQDTRAVADALNAGRTRLVDRRIGETVLAATIGMRRARQAIDALKRLASGTVPGFDPELAEDLSYVVRWLAEDKLDVGNPQTREHIDLFVPGVFTREEAEAIKALGEEPDPATVHEVNLACWSNRGDWLALPD